MASVEDPNGTEQHGWIYVLSISSSRKAGSIGFNTGFLYALPIYHLSKVKTL